MFSNDPEIFKQFLLQKVVYFSGDKYDKLDFFNFKFG